MTETKVIREYGTIFNKEDFPGAEDNFENIYLNEEAFINLKNFVSENTDSEIEVESAFSVHRKKSKDYIRVKNYVGVIETRNKTVIEVLPKVYLHDAEDEKKDSRIIFLRMLRHLRNSPFKSIDEAHLKTSKFPLLEIFIFTFLEELDLLLKRGIRKHYQNKDENEKFLKGSLNFSKQIQHNLIHKERFFVNYDEFCVDIAHNRLIKSTLVLLLSKTRIPKNKIRIYNHLAFMEDVPASKHLHKDFNKVQNLNRLFSHYAQVLAWAKVFLIGESFTNFKGKSLNKAILFPMERIFEDYIGAGFKKYYQNAEILLQEKKVSLVDEHKGSKKFRLKPDIVLKNEQNMILDTKWKIINQNDSRRNYGISSSDMYQLFAYGKKYESTVDNPLLVLLYPKHESFTQSLSDFDYDDNLKLKAVPVELDCTLQMTITNIKNEIQKEEKIKNK